MDTFAIDFVGDCLRAALSIFDTVMTASGLVRFFFFCFSTFMVYRFLLAPLFGREIPVHGSDRASVKSGYAAAKHRDDRLGGVSGYLE